MTAAVRRRLPVFAAALVVLAACGREAPLPTPRPLVVFSGVRVNADAEKMREVDRWFREQMHNIDRDPSFLIITQPQEEPVHPWETLELRGDTAHIRFGQRAPEARAIFLIYAHYHLMAERGPEALGRWLPEAADATGFALEHAILERVADAWLLGRSVYDAAPHPPLDEILYAREHGWLDAMILTAQREAYEEERAEWLEENPEEPEAYRDWFEETFARVPPGWREAS